MAQVATRARVWQEQGARVRGGRALAPQALYHCSALLAVALVRLYRRPASVPKGPAQNAPTGSVAVRRPHAVGFVAVPSASSSSHRSTETMFFGALGGRQFRQSLLGGCRPCGRSVTA